MDQAPIFVFDAPEPAHVTVYPNLGWARESLESLDAAGDGYEPRQNRARLLLPPLTKIKIGTGPAFTVTGRIIQITPSDDLFASFEVTEQVALEQLRTYFASAEVRHTWRTILRPTHGSG